MKALERVHKSSGRDTRSSLSSIYTRAVDNTWTVSQEFQDWGQFPPFMAIDAQTAFSTNHHTFRSLFFLGGNISKLAIWGAENRATPYLFLLCVFPGERLLITIFIHVILFCGSNMSMVEKQISVTSNNQVVLFGTAARLLMTTSGSNIIPSGLNGRASRFEDSDALIISVTRWEHDSVTLNQRENSAFERFFQRDCMYQNPYLLQIKTISGKKCLFDAARNIAAVVSTELSSTGDLRIEVTENYPRVSFKTVRFQLRDLITANKEKRNIVILLNTVRSVINTLRSEHYGQHAIFNDSASVTPEVGPRRRYGVLHPLELTYSKPLPRIC